MRKAGINDYEAFARDILQTVKDKSISSSVLRRLCRDAPPGAKDQRLQANVTSNSDHQYARRIVTALIRELLVRE